MELSFKPGPPFEQALNELMKWQHIVETIESSEDYYNEIQTLRHILDDMVDKSLDCQQELMQNQHSGLKAIKQCMATFQTFWIVDFLQQISPDTQTEPNPISIPPPKKLDQDNEDHNLAIEETRVWAEEQRLQFENQPPTHNSSHSEEEIKADTNLAQDDYLIKEEEELKITKNYDNIQNRWVCAECDLVFRRRDEMRDHKRSVHIYQNLCSRDSDTKITQKIKSKVKRELLLPLNNQYLPQTYQPPIQPPLAQNPQFIPSVPMIPFNQPLQLQPQKQYNLPQLPQQSQYMAPMTGNYLPRIRQPPSAQSGLEKIVNALEKKTLFGNDDDLIQPDSESDNNFDSNEYNSKLQTQKIPPPIPMQIQQSYIPPPQPIFNSTYVNSNQKSRLPDLALAMQLPIQPLQGSPHKQQIINYQGLKVDKPAVIQPQVTYQQSSSLLDQIREKMLSSQQFVVSKAGEVNNHVANSIKPKKQFNQPKKYGYDPDY